jgi:sarcosine oxidase
MAVRGCDVVVIGAGAMGSASAWRLAARGREVVLLERFEPGHVRGSSHGSARIFRLAYPIPDYIRMAQRAMQGWMQLEEEAGEELLHRTGGADHGEPAALDAIAQALEACGVGCEFLGPAGAAAAWPGMRFDGPVLYQADAGRLYADRAVAALHRLASGLGADLRFNEGSEGIRLQGDRAIVTTARDEYRAPAVVIACGPWLTSVVGEHVKLPRIRVTKEQPAHFAPLDASAPWPSFIHHGPVTMYGLGAPEGVKVGEHRTGPEVGADERNFETDPSAAGRLVRYVSEWLPGLDPESVALTTCLYTNAPADDFLLDRRGPLVVASACSGHGFKFTPEVGNIIADLATGTALSPQRFRMPAGQGIGAGPAAE